jgi:hypothetical protein
MAIFDYTRKDVKKNLEKSSGAARRAIIQPTIEAGEQIARSEEGTRRKMAGP